MEFDASGRARKALAAVLSGLALALGGAMLVVAGQQGWWATLSGALLVIVWIITLATWTTIRSPSGLGTASGGPVPRDAQAEVSVLRALLDQLPVPLISQDRDGARALNRAARALFATDSRIAVRVPRSNRKAGDRLEIEGRNWKVAWVDTAPATTLGALIDVDAEQRAADLRAGDEMVDILGHELLNGLSPVVSLADSAVMAQAKGDPCLPEILGTLARRVEGLENFTKAYRALSRLPAPVPGPVSLVELMEDLSRLFASRYGPSVELGVDLTVPQDGWLDREQMSQAVWALLQNAAEAALCAPAPHRVRLVVTRQAKGLCWRVEDSGPGIASVDRTRIFRPFFTTKQQGSGIGLSLARKIARGHGGELRLLASVPTAFEMVLPSEQGNLAS